MGEMISLGGGAGADWSLFDAIVEASDDESISESVEPHCATAPSEVTKEPEATATAPASTGYGRTGYLFPANDPAVVKGLTTLAEKSDTELRELFKKLTTGRYKDTGQLPAYATVRPFIISISMILNERQVWPPRFRTKRKVKHVSKGVAWGDESSMLSNDRQVLDLHWLACSGSGVQPSGKWAGLFSGDGLNFNEASEFVATVGDTATKIQVLGVHQGEMRQLAVLQSQDMQKSWADLEARVDTEARPRLREWKEKQKKRATASIDELLVQFLVLGLVRERWTDAARLASQVLGFKVSAKTMERRFDLFQDRKLLRRTSS